VNFNYSYKAFLVTSLLVGNLILLLLLVKLDGNPTPEVTTVPVEYTELLPEEEPLALATPQEQAVVKTNTAYNEAETFIREVENERNAPFDESESEETQNLDWDGMGVKTDFNQAQKELQKTKRTLAEAAKKKAKTSAKSVNRKTTMTYQLVNRTALYLPNPVYTCEGSGKIVISIEVNALGKVTKANYNGTLSTTANGCLIDEALAYANESRFNTQGDKPKQLGTITYLFPGQE